MIGVHYPFSAVVGQEDVKLALLLGAVQPSIGGVLLSGDRGSAKTTLVRALAALLPGTAPFVELPLGATEEAVVGSLDLKAALNGDPTRFQPGLLAQAHGGVLYVDEVNLLADHLVDVLLDVASSGVNRVERDGVSHVHPSHFLLVGSMNPEEGQLRPQLIDRFGLSVTVRAPVAIAERAEVVKRRLAYDDDQAAFSAQYKARERLMRYKVARCASALPAHGLPQVLLAPIIVEQVSTLCVEAGAEGLRADLSICRAATALARWEGRSEVTVADVVRVAPLALSHRSQSHFTRSAQSGPGALADALQHLVEAGAGGTEATPEQGDIKDQGHSPAGDAAPAPNAPTAAEQADDEAGGAPGPPDRDADVGLDRRGEPTRLLSANRRGRAQTGATPGRVVADQPVSNREAPIALAATIRAAAARQGDTQSERPGHSALEIDTVDLREQVRQPRQPKLVVIAVDASGSMAARHRVAAARAVAVGLLVEAYQRRDLVSLVSFAGDTAQILLQPTGSMEVARARLADIPTGGHTPLAEGISLGVEVATRSQRRDSHRPHLVVLTDGRATGPARNGNAWESALMAAATVRRLQLDALVIDAEEGPVRLGMAEELARAMGAECVSMAELSTDLVDAVINRSVANAVQFDRAAEDAMTKKR